MEPPTLGLDDSGEPTPEFVELMARVRTLSDGAARELIERYGTSLLRVVRWRMHKKLRPKFDSQDFVQSVWASFFALPLQNYDFESPEELARFLVDLAQNKVVDAVRQRINGAKYNVNREEFSLNDSQLPQNIAQTPAREPTPAELAVARELWDRMLSSGEDLHQRIVQRATTSTKTMRELAEEIGVSERTIRRVLRHAANQKESS